MKMTRAKSAGTRIVEILNARPRICSRYSRLATSNRLRIGLASHGLNEYLFERRFNEFESVDVAHRGGFMEQLLRIAVGMKANLRVRREALCFGNLRAVESTVVAV